MKDHEIILKMIDEADPNDTAKLDEIDARVACFLENWDYEGAKINSGISCIALAKHSDKKYTSSRDALKSIRPNGWWFDIEMIGSEGVMVTAYNDKTKLDHKDYTEELAELHAIIQAIAYEREMK